MRHFPRTMLGIGIIAIAAILAWLAVASLRSKEPQYQGKALSVWVDDLAVDKRNLSESASLAAERQRWEALTNVVHSIGTNGLPYYLVWIENAPRESSRLERFKDWLARVSGSRVRLPEGKDRMHEAVLAVQILGPNAKSALTRLERLLNNESSCGAAGRCLTAIGGDSVPVLIAALSNARSERVRYAAAQALGDLGALAKPAKAVLLDQMRNPKPQTSPGITTADLALRALVEMELPEQEIMPLLATQFFATNAAAGAAYGLARTGASGTVPLLHALTNENTKIRCAAETAFELRDFLQTERATFSPVFDHFNAKLNNRLLQATIRPYVDAERRTIEAIASAQTNNADMSVRSAASNVLDYLRTFSRTGPSSP